MFDIDWEIVEFQTICMEYENDIYEATIDKDFKKVEFLKKEYDNFLKDNDCLLK